MTDFSKYGTPIVNTNQKSSVDFSKYGTAVDNSNVVAEPVKEKKNSFLKNIIAAPATIIARPIQAIAQGVFGASPEAVDKFSKEKLGGIVAPVPQNFSDVKKDIGRGVQTVALGMGPVSGGAAFGAGNSLEQGNDLFSKQTAIQTGVGAFGGKLLDVIGKPLLNVAGKQIGKITPQVVEDVVAKGSKSIQDFAARHNILPEQISNIINKSATKIESIANKPFDLTTMAAKKLTTQSEKQIENSVLERYEKGVKPLINAKMTPAKTKAYREDVINAVKTIKDNKANLKFNDVDGIEVIGESPKSLQQLADSVEQTKKSVFTKYDTLAKQAGDAGIKVETKPIASELDTVINNKALQLTNPNAVKYAKLTQARYSKAGPLDAVTAQDVIQNYNKSLEAFYRNPSYDNASQAAIDAMVANNMRKALDEGITGLTGQEYAALKKQYGSLKAVEKDVIKAALRDARKNTKGLIDFTDIFSGGQIVNGILSLNPAQVGSGIAQKGITTFYKYLNNPNRAIEKMFTSAENLPQLNFSKNFQKTNAIKPSAKPPIKAISKTLPQPRTKVKLPAKPPKLK